MRLLQNSKVPTHHRPSNQEPPEVASCSESRTMLQNTLSAGRGTSPSDRARVGVDPRVMHFEPDPWTRGRGRLETPLSQGPFSQYGPLMSGPRASSQLEAAGGALHPDLAHGL